MKATSFLLPSAIVAMGAAGAMADTAFVGSYKGSIETVHFDPQSGVFESVASTDASPQPSWQELSPDKKFLYTIHESSGLTSFKVGSDGNLTKVSSATTLPGPVSLAISPDQNMIVTANYGSGSASILRNNPTTGNVTWLGNLKFGGNGTSTEEGGSKPHQALFDYTGKYVIMPDLAADVIRRFSVNSNATRVEEMLKELAPVELMKGTGPRHGVFYPSTGEPQYYYVVGETSKRVFAFELSYEEEGLEFDWEKWVGTLPRGYEDPINATQPAAAAELVLSPAINGSSSPHLYASNRFDRVFPTGNSIAMFNIDPGNGNLTFSEVYNSGVNNTRHFSIHPSGKWLVNEGQFSNDLVTWELDPMTGVPAKQQTSMFSVEAPVCLTWL